MKTAILSGLRGQNGQFSTDGGKRFSFAFGGRMERARKLAGSYAELPKPSALIAEYRLELQKLL